MSDDEHLDYLPTQAVAEFLIHHFHFEIDGQSTRIEAIIFRSAQDGRRNNIAIFGAAASVGDLEINSTKNCLVTTERDVREGKWTRRHKDFRLAVDPKTVETRHITAATYSSVRIGDGSAVGDALFDDS